MFTIQGDLHHPFIFLLERDWNMAKKFYLQSLLKLYFDLIFGTNRMYSKFQIEICIKWDIVGYFFFFCDFLVKIQFSFEFSFVISHLKS